MSFDGSHLVSIIGNSINNGSIDYNIECVLMEDFKISNVNNDFFLFPSNIFYLLLKKHV